MDRHQELALLKAYTDNVGKEVTLLLQNLQWDPKLITEKRAMVTCKYDLNHRVTLEGRDAHEKQCYLTKLGYKKDDIFLPDPVDPGANTIVKFSKHEITEIINNAALDNPSFKKGCSGLEPLTVERLQKTYTADERRAIHDAVVNAAPFCHDLTDLDLLSSNNDAKESQKKSRLEILAELRNMKRRRTKYRVAPKTRNYSDVLRDVIKTQMDSYGETTRTIIKTEYGPSIYVSQKVSNSGSENVLPHGMVIELERGYPDTHSYNRYQGEGSRESYRARIREKGQNDNELALRKYDFKDNDRYCTERNSKKSHNSEERRYFRDKNSNKESTRCYDHQKEYNYGRSRERRYNDDESRYSDYSSRDKSQNYDNYNKFIKTEHDIKQERASQESYTNHSRDRSHDRNSKRRRHHNSEDKRYNHDRSRSKERTHGDLNKYSHIERSEKHHRRHPDRVIKQERETSPSNSYTTSETSRKRHRSRSREKRHKDKKRRHDKDKYSKKDKGHDSRKRKHEYSLDMVKQERESP